MKYIAKKILGTKLWPTTVDSVNVPNGIAHLLRNQESFH
jgi:hypothetical protein